MKRITKKILLGCCICAAAVVALIFGCNTIVEYSAKGKTYDSVSKIPHRKVGLLLGTSARDREGKRNYYFYHRILATTRLYTAGQIDYVLISGENSSKEYDEPHSMKQALVRNGVPASRIVLDCAGFRTLDSVVRAKEIFGQDKFTIISQEFHNERALYLAGHNDIDAIAYNAKDVKRFKKRVKIHAREYLARVKMFMDIAVGKKPKFSGEKIDLRKAAGKDY